MNRLCIFISKKQRAERLFAFFVKEAAWESFMCPKSRGNSDYGHNLKDSEPEMNQKSGIRSQLKGFCARNEAETRISGAIQKNLRQKSSKKRNLGHNSKYSLPEMKGILGLRSL
jgi:hypothetical protein